MAGSGAHGWPGSLCFDKRPGRCLALNKFEKYCKYLVSRRPREAGGNEERRQGEVSLRSLAKSGPRKAQGRGGGGEGH